MCSSDLIHAAAHAPPLTPVVHAKDKDLSKAWAVNARAMPFLLASLDPAFAASEDGGEAVFFEDERRSAPYWSLYAATKSAGLDFARSYAAEAAHRGFRAHFHTPPAMPTSLHARFFPGHDPDALTPCAEAAEGVLALT